jgi:hypothetical protein
LPYFILTWTKDPKIVHQQSMRGNGLTICFLPAGPGKTVPVLLANVVRRWKTIVGGIIPFASIMKGDTPLLFLRGAEMQKASRITLSGNPRFFYLPAATMRHIKCQLFHTRCLNFDS